MRYIALFALIFLIGCAQVIEEDNAEQQSSVDRNWSRLSMTKADLANTDATLGIKAIELLPGETPEEAVMRVFGVVPTYDVRKLLDTHEVAETNLFDHSTDSSGSSSICNDSCPYANDGYCDERDYVRRGLIARIAPKIVDKTFPMYRPNIAVASQMMGIVMSLLTVLLAPIRMIVRM